MERAVYYGKRLNCPGLKPTDWFLFTQAEEYLGLDMREVLTLGLRMIYAALHGQVTRENVLNMAAQIHAEDLNHEDKATRPMYKEFSRITTG